MPPLALLLAVILLPLLLLLPARATGAGPG